MELCGTASNLDVATYVHGFLLETGERLWRGHRQERRLTGNAERRRYLLGVMMGFDDKLNEATKENRREGLIWIGDPGADRVPGPSLSATHRPAPASACAPPRATKTAAAPAATSSWPSP